MNKQITINGICNAADFLGLSVAQIQALPCLPSGFDSLNNLVGEFDLAAFQKLTKVKSDKPDLAEAMKLDRDAAIQATLWGKYKSSGADYDAVGHPNAGSFYDALCVNEDAQLAFACRLMLKC